MEREAEKRRRHRLGHRGTAGTEGTAAAIPRLDMQWILDGQIGS